MSATPRAAAAALVRACAATIVPEVVAEATAGGRKATDIELQRRLTAFLERRIPLWVQALEADDLERATASGVSSVRTLTLASKSRRWSSSEPSRSGTG